MANKQEPLTVFDVCLKTTASFEGSDFGTVTGNFDGCGLSLGLMQWNLRSETFKNYILSQVNLLSYDYFPVPITPLARLDGEQAVTWAKDVMLKIDGSVRDEWKIAWKEFLTNSAIINLQKVACGKYFHQAKCLAGRYGFKYEDKRAMAFFYDVSVQCWNMRDIENVDPHKEQATNILQMNSSENMVTWCNTELTEDQQKLVILAHYRSKKCLPEWRNDFFIRKATIAIGQGIVHKQKYDFRKLFMES